MEEKVTQQQILFAKQIHDHMVNHFEIDFTVAVLLTMKYISDINVEDAIAQHLGADYFAIQILMAEGVIPYKPM